jgi:hypothetical protein
MIIIEEDKKGAKRGMIVWGEGNGAATATRQQTRRLQSAFKGLGLLPLWRDK